MSAGAICSRTVYTATRRETVLEAAERMQDHMVGTLVVVDGNGRPEGLLTDRDIVIRCVAEGDDPETTSVGAIMTQPLETVSENTPIEMALKEMANAEVRRIVVTDDADGLVGILSLDDVLELLVEESRDIGRLLRAQEPV